MLRTLLALLVLVPLAATQAAGPGAGPGAGQGAGQGEVAITGVVEPQLLPTICMQGTHRIDCTGVLLQSSSLDLDQYVGKLVRLHGQDVGVECPVIEVESIDDPPATLTMCGTTTPGCPIKLKICPAGLSQYWLWAALVPGFVPLAPSKGSWLLGEPFFLIATGGGGGLCHELVFTTPGSPALIGVPIWMQAARRDIGPVGPPSLTNAICFTIAVFSPCTPIDC